MNMYFILDYADVYSACYSLRLSYTIVTVLDLQGTLPVRYPQLLDSGTRPRCYSSPCFLLKLEMQELKHWTVKLECECAIVATFSLQVLEQFQSGYVYVSHLLFENPE